MDNKLHILVIDAFDVDSRSGESALNIFRSTVRTCLKACNISESMVTWRRLNHLQDYVVDWEYSRLDENSRACAKLFDSVHLIICGGDLSYLPWDPRCTQLIALFNMSNKVDKPVLALGSTALVYLYALHTAGRRYHVINGPRGGPRKDIASFPTYTTHHGVFPGAYLDNEVGDLYTYDSKSKSWIPTCNIGMKFVSQSLYSHQPLAKKHFSRDDRIEGGVVENTDQDPRNINNTLMGDLTGYVSPSMQKHPFLRRLGDSSFFVMNNSISRNWQITVNTGGVPGFAASHLKVLAHSHCGSVLFANGNAMILSASTLEKSNIVIEEDGSLSCRSSVNRLILSWLDDVISRMREDANSSRLIYEFLFPRILQDHLKENRYNSLHDKELYKHVPPVSSAPIKTSILPNGPRKVDPPLMSIFNYFDVKDGNESTYSKSYVSSPPKSEPNSRPATLPTRHSSPTNFNCMTLKDTSAYYKPSQFKAPEVDITRDTRLKNLMDTMGYSDTKAVVDAKRDIDNSMKITWKSPKTAKIHDLISGLTFDSTKIMPRRRPVGDRLVTIDNVILYSPREIDEEIASTIVTEENDSTGPHCYHPENTALLDVKCPGISHMSIPVRILQKALTPGRNRVRANDEVFLIPGEYDSLTGRIEPLMPAAESGPDLNFLKGMSPTHQQNHQNNNQYSQNVRQTIHGLSQSAPTSPRGSGALSPRAIKEACAVNYLPVHVPKEAAGKQNTADSNNSYSPTKPGFTYNLRSHSPKFNDSQNDYGGSLSARTIDANTSADISSFGLKLNLLEINDSICSIKEPNDNSPITIRQSPRSYYFKKRENNELNLVEKVEVFKTQYEKERSEYMEKKKGFLAGDFKTCNPAPMPLRRPSLLADASYPDSPRVASMVHAFPSIKTLGSAMLVRENEVDKRIAGPWKPLDLNIYDR